MYSIAYVNDYMGTSLYSQEKEREEFKVNFESRIDITVDCFDSLNDFEAYKYDVVVFDYGGIVGMGCDGLINSETRVFLKMLSECPNTLFIINTRTLSYYIRADIEEFFGFSINNIPNLVADCDWVPDTIKTFLDTWEVAKKRLY